MGKCEASIGGLFEMGITKEEVCEMMDEMSKRFFMEFLSRERIVDNKTNELEGQIKDLQERMVEQEKNYKKVKVRI
jgi:hypothetical protein